MKRIFSILRFISIAAPVVCLRCVPAQLAGGGTIETTNGAVIGTIVFPSGGPAPGTQVKLLPAGYDPVKDTANVLTETADVSGKYAFPHVPPGAYTVQMMYPINKTTALRYGIQVHKDTIATPVSVLNAPGSIKVSLPSGINNITGYVYIPGTTLFTFLNKYTDFAVIDSVAAGIVPEIVYSTTNSGVTDTMRCNVNVISGDTAVVRNPIWKYAGAIVLNTSATGANVAGTVENFPMLIRLNSGNFDFTQALPNGADIRFAKSDNTFLPYQIERWDTAGRHAELWVKVDTVRGSDSTQLITMYWGNPGASDSSSGAAVFDTAAGFRGVWHLGESVGKSGDATVNRYDGGRNGSQTRDTGVIGYAQRYSGSGDYTDMGNVCNPGPSRFTVCAWVKLSTTRQYQTIVAKSKGNAPSSSYGWLVEVGSDGALAAFIATDTGTWGDPRTFVLASTAHIVDTGAWHHVAAVIDPSGNNSCRLYIDGSDVTPASPGGDIAGLGPVANSVPLRLGSDAKSGSPLKGVLDECSVAFTARSPDWIHLCYMNQRQRDALVQW